MKIIARAWDEQNKCMIEDYIVVEDREMEIPGQNKKHYKAVITGHSQGSLITDVMLYTEVDDIHKKMIFEGDKVRATSPKRPGQVIEVGSTIPDTEETVEVNEFFVRMPNHLLVPEVYDYEVIGNKYDGGKK